MASGASENTTAVDRALTLLLQIGRSDCDRPLADHARELLMPLSTAHRLAVALERQALLARPARGIFVLGASVQDLGAPCRPTARLAKYARQPLRRLGERHGATAHLGVWDGDMVHYLVKEPRQSPLLTCEGGRLEGYCSAIGKVLLANLPDEAHTAYMAAGPFVALTPRTITDDAALERCLDQVNRRGYAVDDEEVAPGLRCVAVPVQKTPGQVVAAISVSRPDIGTPPSPELIASLRRTAAVIADIAAFL